jgi:pyridoxal phosphate enzyme (YggS family)
MTASIAARYQQVAQRIEAAARRAGRDPHSIRLIGASKFQPIESLQAAWAAGLRSFGESRVQELLVKAPALPQADWHFLGSLQRNKARKAVEWCSLIHSLDSLRLAESLARLGQERGHPVEALIEVNLGGESSKGGVAPEQLLPFWNQTSQLTGLRIRGLMAIPPPAEPEVTRRQFRVLATWRDRLRQAGEAATGLDELSIGMSEDFEIAIEEGATMVRIGTLLFGERSLYTGPAGQVS